jgi:hypothetical protein
LLRTDDEYIFARRFLEHFNMFSISSHLRNTGWDDLLLTPPIRFRYRSGLARLGQSRFPFAFLKRFTLPTFKASRTSSIPLPYKSSVLSDSESSVLSPRANDSTVCLTTSTISGKLRSLVLKVARAFPSSDSTSTVIGTREIRLVGTLADE